MATAIRNCLGVDIGSHSIRVANMEMGKAGPRIVSLLEKKIELEAGLSEDKRQASLARQLQELLKTGKIRTKNAVFCVPGQSVFVRRIKLPKTTPERMSRIIRFEARQQIPFPLDKTIMEYQVFEEGDANEVNVLLVAIKRDFIESFMKLVRRTGLRPLAVSVSSLALYNFQELNSSTRSLLGEEKKEEKKAKVKASKKGKDAAAATAVAEPEEEDLGPALDALSYEEIPAYVNLGAALADLAIPKPGASHMIGFTRSVPLAGAEMDRAIQSRLNLADASQARTIKERETVILSTEFEAEANPGQVNVEASEAVTAVADRLISELRRSLDFYISQPDGVAVDSIVLSGGLARLRYLSGYIEEKLGLPVQLVEVKHPQLRLPDTPVEPFCPYAIAVGLALQGLQLAQNKINFLPEDIKNVRSLQDRRWEAVAAVIMLVVLVGLNFNVGASYISSWNNEVAKMGDQINKISEQNTLIGKLEGRNAKVGEAYDKLAKTASYRDYWFMFLNQVLRHRPADVLFDEIQMRADGNVVIKGKSVSRGSVSQMIDNLKTVSYGFFEVGLQNMSPQPVADPRFTDRVFDYTIIVKTLVRQARIRTIGDQPVVPKNTQQQGTGTGQRMGGYGFPVMPQPGAAGNTAGGAQ